jgi:hypothetical protein
MVRAGTAGRHVTVRGDIAVVEWARRYLGGWWPVTGDGDGPVVHGVTDVDTYRSMADRVGPAADRVPMMFGVKGRRRATPDAVLAWCGERAIAYHHDRATATTVVAGPDPREVMFHVTRLARLLVTNALESDGWTMLHAGCAVGPRGAILFPGGPGAGKTTASLLAARRPGWRLLATDLCLVRADGGAVRVAAVPTSIRMGMGLLAALGWAPRVAEAIRDGTDPHPHQHPEVADRLAAGDYAARFDGTGRELKYQLMPQELGAWFGVPVVAGATVHDVLFPQLRPGRAALEDTVFWGPSGGYPNFLEYPLPAPPADRPATAAVLGLLPPSTLGYPVPSSDGKWDWIAQRRYEGG